MTEIKICGITDREDALFAAACGADALGFIFYSSSPRYVVPEKVKWITSYLPNKIVKVGVFVNHDIADVNRIVDYCGLDLVQMHGDESAEYCRQFPPTLLIKAVSPVQYDEFVSLHDYPLRAILVDAREAELFGGTGKKADWDLARKAKRIAPLILAGGLNERNIEAALTEVFPDAVDINSGVELAPGKKDWKKLENVFEIVRCHNSHVAHKKIFTREK